MQNSKSVSTPFSVGCKLSSKQCPGNEADSEDVSSTMLVGSRKSYACCGVYVTFNLSLHYLQRKLNIWKPLMHARRSYG